MTIVGTAWSVIGSSLSTVAGGLGGLFELDAPVRRAELIFDDDARLPGRTDLLIPGRRAPALVHIPPDGDNEGDAIRTVCVELPEVYGQGRAQDSLLASSADGVPFHHVGAGQAHRRAAVLLAVALPRRRLTGALRLAGHRQRITVPDQRRARTLPSRGDIAAGDAAEIGSVQFDARNGGGEIRPLPAVMFCSG